MIVFCLLGWRWCCVLPVSVCGGIDVMISSTQQQTSAVLCCRQWQSSAQGKVVVCTWGHGRPRHINPRVISIQRFTFIHKSIVICTIYINKTQYSKSLLCWGLTSSVLLSFSSLEKFYILHLSLVTLYKPLAVDQIDLIKHQVKKLSGYPTCHLPPPFSKPSS